MPRRMSVLAFWRNGIIERNSRNRAKAPREENPVAQDWRFELVFYFLKFVEEKFPAGNFFAVAET